MMPETPPDKTVIHTAFMHAIEFPSNSGKLPDGSHYYADIQALCQQGQIMRCTATGTQPIALDDSERDALILTIADAAARITPVLEEIDQ